jgi:hypothetical protein
MMLEARRPGMRRDHDDLFFDENEQSDITLRRYAIEVRTGQLTGSVGPLLKIHLFR